MYKSRICRSLSFLFLSLFLFLPSANALKVKKLALKSSGDSLYVKGWTQNNRYLIYFYTKRVGTTCRSEQLTELKKNNPNIPDGALTDYTIFVKFRLVGVLDTRTMKKSSYLSKMDLKGCKGVLQKKTIKAELRKAKKGLKSKKALGRFFKKNPMIMWRYPTSPDGQSSFAYMAGNNTKVKLERKKVYTLHIVKPPKKMDKPILAEMHAQWNRKSGKNLWKKTFREEMRELDGVPTSVLAKLRVEIAWRPDSQALAVLLVKDLEVQGARYKRPKTEVSLYLLQLKQRKGKITQMHIPVRLVVNKKTMKLKGYKSFLQKAQKAGFNFKVVARRRGAMGKSTLYTAKGFGTLAQKLGALLPGKAKRKKLSWHTVQPIILRLGYKTAKRFK